MKVAQNLLFKAAPRAARLAADFEDSFGSTSAPL